MNKMLTLIKATLTQDMSLFKLQSKKLNKKTQVLVPIILAIIIMNYMGSMFYSLMTNFKDSNLQYVALTMFGLLISILTLVEGLYKSSTLLFNCKDDQLLLSLPLSKNQVLFIRMFKFYLFELLYNSMFLAPGMIVYGVNMNVSWTYYLVSVISLFILPIVPIILSCIFGFIMTYITIKFKGKNLVQTIITMAILLVIIYYSMTMDTTMIMLKDNAINIHNFICKIYYPVGAYMSLINNFNIVSLLIYILIHIAILLITILVMGKYYFKLNSSIKSTSATHNSKPYIIKTNKPAISFVKKELNKFLYTPVFITNAGFGLVMYIAASIALCFKYDAIKKMLLEKVTSLTTSMINSYTPVIVLLLIAFTALMTSITSSMISLEGKKFYILKSLPIKSSMIVLYKVLAALTIMIPCILLGDVILFIYFKLDIISIICLLYATVLLPFIAELIGIMVNLKYPKMDAANDTEIVKQSMSSMISVFIGMMLLMLSSVILIGLIVAKLNAILIEIIYLLLFTIIAIVLWLRLVKTVHTSFENIQA